MSFTTGLSWAETASELDILWEIEEFLKWMLEYQAVQTEEMNCLFFQSWRQSPVLHLL